MTFRAIQPAHWAGMMKGGADTPMVCGACPDWEACAKANWCERATQEDYDRVHELGAISHVRQRIAEDGAHDVAGCPLNCRAMCQYRGVIKRMQASGRWPENL